MENYFPHMMKASNGNNDDDNDELFSVLHQRKKQMMDDYVEYYIMIMNDHCSDSLAQYSELLEQMNDFLYRRSELMQQQMNAYIWQREPFQLSVRSRESLQVNHNDKRTSKKRFENDDANQCSSSSRSSNDENNVVDHRYCIHGRTKFGENVDDEWFIVHILYEISKQFPNCAIHVSDNDGAFLLIESALFLPDWLEDSNESNQYRIFIYRGKLHWIPDKPFDPSHVASHGAWWLNQNYRSVLDSIDLFSMLTMRSSLATMANNKMQQAIQKRIQVYPQKIFKDFHHARVYLPKPIQYLLQQDVQFVSYLVRSFIKRNTESMKFTVNMKRLMSIRDETLPSEEHEQLSETCSFCIVKMTKCLYAQLQSHRFSAPRILRNIFQTTRSNDEKAMNIGVKLTCAFEMLYWQNYEPSSHPNSDPQSIINSSNRLKEQWNKYKENLNRIGYFRDEREGSALYRNLDAQAKQSFVTSMTNSETSHTGNPSLSTPSVWIDLMLQHYSPKLLTDTSKQPEDSDTWMDTGEGLDEYIEMKHQDTNIEMNNNEEHVERKAMEMIQGMKSFITNLSSVEGAEFPKTPHSNRTKEASHKNDFEAKLEKLFSGLQLDDILDDQEREELHMGQDEDEPNEFEDYMDAYMDAMDEQLSELYGTGRDKNPSTDKDMLQNLLESYKAQSGSAGPLSNLMREMGIEIPEDADDFPLDDQSTTP